MKVLNVIKKFIIGLLGIAFFAFAISMTVILLNRNKYGVTKMDNTSFIVIRDEISSDKYKKGDLVFVKDKKSEDVKIGDELFVYHVDKDGVVTIDLGIVGKLHPNEKAISFENGSTYSYDFIIGTATKVYNKLGTYYGVVQSRWGFLFIILVPSFLIFIYEIYALIAEIKYGREEHV